MKNFLYIFSIFFLLVCFGIVIGVVFTSKHYNDKYIHLRSEIRSITGVDITYPYSTPMTIDRRTNKAWFDNK